MKDRRLPAKGMRMAVAVVLAYLMASSSACMWGRQAKKRSGANVVVQKTDGQKVNGELVGVRSEGIVLDTKKGAATIPISDVESLWTLEKQSPGRRAALTAMGAIGGTIGCLLGVSLAKNSRIHTESWPAALGIASAFMAVGTAAGASVPLYMANKPVKGDVYDFKNKSPEEIEQMLTTLRKLARVPDYR